MSLVGGVLTTVYTPVYTLIYYPYALHVGPGEEPPQHQGGGLGVLNGRVMCVGWVQRTADHIHIFSFRKGGEGYQSRINAVLRGYMRGHQRKPGKSA